MGSGSASISAAPAQIDFSLGEVFFLLLLGIPFFFDRTKDDEKNFPVCKGSGEAGNHFPRAPSRSQGRLAQVSESFIVRLEGTPIHHQAGQFPHSPEQPLFFSTDQPD